MGRWQIFVGAWFNSRLQTSFKKTALAAISYLLRVHCMESLFDFKHLYPNIHNALSVFVYYFVFCDVLTLFACRSGELN
jgi:hypothetical protein